jgi:peroxiredoxin
MDGRGTLDEHELAYLETLTALGELQILGVPVSDRGLAHLAGLLELKSLMVLCYTFGQAAADGSTQGLRITDEGLRQLAGMQKLQSLQIGGRITDQGLEHLASLASLRNLYLESRTVTDDAVADLRRKRPGLGRVSIDSQRLKETLKAGQLAPDFTVKTLDGGAFRLADHRGQAVLLYFWGTWCRGCVASAPELKAFHDELAATHGDRFAMLSLSFFEEEALPRRHAERHHLNWPQAALGDDPPIVAAYGVWGAPTYVVIGPDGLVAPMPNHPSLDDLRQAVAGRPGTPKSPR